MHLLLRNSFFFKSANVFDIFSALEAVCDPGGKRRCLLSSPGMYRVSTQIIMGGELTICTLVLDETARLRSRVLSFE